MERPGRRAPGRPVWDSHAQFWFHYRLTLTTPDPAEQALLLDSEFWEARLTELTFRNLRLGEVASRAFPALPVFDEHGRVRMRGLHLSE